MRILLSATAAMLACGLAIATAHAQSETVTFSAMGTDNSDNSGAVSISGSFLITVPPDSVADSDNWDGVSDFTVTFTGLAGYPDATFTSTNLATILAPATEYGGPFYNFDYNPFPTFVAGLFNIEADGLDDGNNYYGFDIQDEDGAGYSYAVDNTTYSGNLYAINVDDPAFATPEPASMALLGMGMIGLAAARRRRRAG